MNKFLATGEKKECCGCLACVQKCPAKALTQVMDKEGFIYPKLDVGKCVQCGICEKVCSFERNRGNEVQEVYAFKHTNKSVRMGSSSGGAFTAISDYFLQQGYKIYGVILDEKGEAVHIGSTEIEIRDKMRGSKYVQSNIDGIYISIESQLRLNEKILFVGTPCQVNGLKLYLRKEYENLITIDLICHGVVSPLVFREYLNLVSNGSRVQEYKFRDKKLADWGTGAHQASIKCEDRSNIKYLPYFMNIFNRSFAFRPSCHNCKFTNTNRVSDITLADFWGIQNIAPLFKDELGVSLVLLNNSKYKTIIENIFSQFCYQRHSLEEVIGFQLHLHQPARESSIRDKFWKSYEKKGGEKTLHIYASDSLYSKWKRKPLEFIRGMKGR